MRKNDITYVAIDAHKKMHQVLMQLPGEEPPVSWTVRNTEREILRMVKRIRKRAPGEVEACYEAGPCGFALQRQLESKGIRCQVIAPSLIPKAPGDRIKTDRRDAAKLLKLQMAGLLTEVCPPTKEEEAVRDLCRCREAAMKDLKRARHRLLKFVLRHGYAFTEGRNWTQKHLEWLNSLRFDIPHEERVFTELFSEIARHQDRVEALDAELEKVAEEAPYKEPVGHLRCFRGIDTVTAVTLVAEIFGILRFDSARELMSYLGLTPSEFSSGESQRKGKITKAGNSLVRRLLVEACWHYRHRPVVSKPLKARRQGQPKWVTETADKAQARLHQRFRHLTKNGKNPNLAVTAMARELAGFIWYVLRKSALEKGETHRKKHPSEKEAA